MKVLSTMAAAAMFAAMSGLAFAQTGGTRPPATRPAPQIDRVILPRLTGLRFIDAATKVEKPDRLRPGVSVEGPVMLYRPGIYQQLQEFLGHPFTTGSAAKITQVIANWYGAHNHPFVDVEFPEQDVTGGVVQIVVTEFRMGHVRVSGNSWFSSGMLASSISLKPGDRIDASVLDQDVAWLNKNPYRQIKIAAQKSDIPGATDLVLETDDRLPIHIFTAYNNGGVPTLGRSNWTIGIDWGNAFFLDQDLSYQFTSSDDFWVQPTRVPVGPHKATLGEHQATYTVPLPWRDRLIFSGNFAQQEPRVAQFFSQVGVSWQASFRYAMSLPSSDTFTQELQFGYDFKRTNNNLAFGGESVSASSTEIDQFPIVYSASLDDDWGRTLFFDQLVYSPGNLTGRNTDAAFQPTATQTGTPFAKANYVYGNFDVTRLTKLPYDTSWILRFQSQYSSTNLLASEELGDGGVESVRGYDEREANGAVGALVSNEFRSPPFGVIDPIFGASTGDQLQADIFQDSGYVQQKRNIPDTQNHVMLMSAGGGLHYVLGRFVDFRFEYGWQLRRPPGSDKRSGEAYFSAVIGY